MTAAGDVGEVKGSCQKAVIRPRVGFFGRGETRCDDVNGLQSSSFQGCRFYLLYYIYQLLITSITLDTVVTVLIRLAE